MKPLQVYLDDNEMECLAAWSQEHGWTKSQAVRAAVRALTRPKGEDALLSLSGMIHDRLPADCSEQFDRYLQGTFVAERATAHKRRHRRARTRG